MDKFIPIPPSIPIAGEDARKPRADGAQSRERLLLAAMRLFAEQGFARTSTREIALAAATNIASISYYFGDKAGLYRAAYNYQNCPNQEEDIARLTSEGQPLRDTLRGFYQAMLGPLKQGEIARLSMRLMMREMLEPTGLWAAEINNGIRPAHTALLHMLSRHLGASEPDDDIARLAFSVVGLAVQLMVTCDVIDQISPQLLAGDQAIDTWIERLVDYADAMIVAEQQRAAVLPSTISPRKTPA